jgi:dienelactone hydrolase
MGRMAPGSHGSRVNSQVPQRSRIRPWAFQRRVACPVLSVLSAVWIVGTGCISQTHIPFRGGQPSRPLRAALTIEPQRPPSGISVVADEDTHTHSVLRLYRPRPCGGSSGTELGALAYLSRAQGAKRWIVVLPIWGSSTYPSQKIVRWLLDGAHGESTNVLSIQGPVGLVRFASLKEATTEAEFMAEVAHTASCIDATAEDVRAFVDWILEQPDADPRRIGIVGFSLGGVVASLVMGRDPRIAAGVFVMAGGHLDEILAYCKWDEREVREHARAAFGWTPDELESAIKAPLSIVDPVLVTGNIDPADVLFIDSGHDGCIPRSARDDLWRALGEPERVTLGYDHKNSFLTMTFLGFNVTTRRIVGFLDNRLGTTAQPLSEAASGAHARGHAP